MKRIYVREVHSSKTRKRENAKRENDFRVRVSKKVKFFRVLFLRFRVSKTRNGKISSFHTFIKMINNKLFL